MREESIILNAGCKVNLFLRIRGKRDDGYHEINTLFYPLPEPCDLLHITNGPPGSGLSLSCALPGLCGSSNILFKAYERFTGATGYRPDLSVRLEKGIPLGAGLGGGSSDAGTLLRFLNRCAGERGLEEQPLLALASGVGADVPFFMSGVPSLADGIGDILEPVDIDLSPFEMVLLCPPVHVSTVDAYEAWDVLPNDLRSLTRAPGLGKKPFCISDVVLFNSFEPAVLPRFPLLRELKLAMLGFGAACCVLSGSGSSLYALFRSEEERRDACNWLKSREIHFFSHTLQRWGVAKR
jgi:4-diphosphocytidyl-2-C-methyl-D-erythritol kinase